MQSIHRVWLALMLLLAGCGLAQAQDADVGLVHQVSGDVSYAGSGSSGRAQAFMKLHRGDRISLAAGAQLRLVYFQNGRQETWRGPASFTTGSAQSEALEGAAYEVAKLPLAVPQRLQKVPQLIQMAKLGGVQVRGLKPKPQQNAAQEAELAAARASYAEMRRQLPADDITPELYLFTVLQDQLLYGEMQSVVEDMLRRQPENADAQKLAEWVRARSPSR